MKYSIITVNFNNAAELAKTVLSVRNQSCKDYEYIVIDGGSTDGSVEVIRSNESGIDYWVSERDRGIYDGMNKGIAVANGEYCLFLNSGDTFYDDNVLKNASGLLDMDFVCGNAMLTEGRNQMWIAPDVVDGLFWRQRNSICHQSVFIRTSLLKETPYDTSLKIVSDYKFFFYELVVMKRSYRHIDMTICNYGCNGISADHEKSDAEKKSVIDEFVRLGYIDEDPLVKNAKRLKVGSRRYKLALWLLSKLLK